VCNDSLQ